jgi:hypothetical protein
MAFSAENLELERQVMALAQTIADTREAVERLENEGGDVSRLRSALAAMSAMFVRYVRHRNALRSANPLDESTSGYRH